MKWRHVKKLIVNFVFQENLKEEDINFSCLSILSSLKELTNEGTAGYFQALVLHHSVLHNIIQNSEQISLLCFREVVIE